MRRVRIAVRGLVTLTPLHPLVRRRLMHPIATGAIKDADLNIPGIELDPKFASAITTDPDLAPLRG